MSEAANITASSQSNLAFAFLCLSKERRADMVTFYAFCRIIDDLADSLDLSVDEKQRGLEQWKHCFLDEKDSEKTPIQIETIKLRDKYHIENQLFLDLIEGCASDLDPQRRFQHWEDLKQYTYRVASCVGLISIQIFGCTNEQSKQYAIALGHALQLTNILRDVEEDLQNDQRIYLPIADMQHFEYSEQDLTQRVYGERFIAVMQRIADRAEVYYTEAIENLTKEDKCALRAAEGMRKIYFSILQKMRKDNFKVFRKRYSISKLRKLYYLTSSQLNSH